MSFGSKSLPPPTADELQRWTEIKERRQCMACGFSFAQPVEVHHLLSGGGLRLGHRFSVGLCVTCHSVVKARWFKERWPNQKILDRQDEAIHWPLVLIPIRRERRNGSSTRSPSKTYRRPA